MNRNSLNFIQVAAASLVSLALFLLPWSSLVVAGLNPIDLARAGAAVLLLFLFLRRRYSGAPVPVHTYFGLGFMTWCFMQSQVLGNSLDADAAYGATKDYILSLSLLSFGLEEFRDMRLTKLGLWSFVGGCFLAILMLAFDITILGVSVRDITSDNRAQLVNVNANWTAYCCASAMALVVALWVKSVVDSSIKWQGVGMYIGTVALLLAGVFLTGTRGAFLAELALVGFLFIFFRKWGKIWLAFSCCLVVGAFFLTKYSNSLMLLERMQMFINTRNLDEARQDVYTAAWNVFIESPFIGVGPGQFYNLNEKGIQAHNGFLSLLSELGLVGFLLYFGTIIFAVQNFRKLNQSKIIYPILLAWLPIFATGVWERSYVAFFSFVAAYGMAFQSGKAALMPQNIPLSKHPSRIERANRRFVRRRMRARNTNGQGNISLSSSKHVTDTHPLPE